MPSLNDLLEFFSLRNPQFQSSGGLPQIPPTIYQRTPEQEQFLLEQLKNFPDKRSLELLFDLRNGHKTKEFNNIPPVYPTGMTGVRG